jgi:hypothetical protein
VRNRARIHTTDGRLHLDVRGDGGFVIAPGSVHASGALYECAGHWDEPRDHLPVFSPDWIIRTPNVAHGQRLAGARSRPTPSSRPPRRDSHNIIIRATAYLAAVPLPEIGQGSDTATLKAACRLVRGFALSAADAEDLLWAWAGGRPGWTRDWVARKVMHAERYGTEPFGAFR